MAAVERIRTDYYVSAMVALDFDNTREGHR